MDAAQVAIRREAYDLAFDSVFRVARDVGAFGEPQVLSLALVKVLLEARNRGLNKPFEMIATTAAGVEELEKTLEWSRKRWPGLARGDGLGILLGRFEGRAEAVTAICGLARTAGPAERVLWFDVERGTIEGWYVEPPATAGGAG